ncbi:hypothetical protein MVEN_00871400 [Mycena venus]|uniref:Uncharacterized protein n=1 Tax=Mycena venus TaxID=2733690 RepID=A0A8H7D3N6_9AGAR|nr:hypothetical protein MVEN_00871400 [Mycena venus]
MLYLFALALFCSNVSFPFVRAARFRASPYDTANFSESGAFEARQFVNDGDPTSFNNNNENDGLSFTSAATTRIVGLTTVDLAITISFAAFALFGILIWICYRQRRRRLLQEAELASATAFRGNWMVTQVPPPAADREAQVMAPPARPERSFSMLKREQTAALPHYDDTHTAPDVLVQTADGLQLLPGSSPPQHNGYQPFWQQSNGLGR